MEAINIAKNPKEALALLLILNPTASGALKVSSDSCHGFVWITHGNIVAVEVGDGESEASETQMLMQLLNIEKGSCEFIETKVKDTDKHNQHRFSTRIPLAKIVDRNFGKTD